MKRSIFQKFKKKFNNQKLERQKQIKIVSTLFPQIGQNVAEAEADDQESEKADMFQQSDEPFSTHNNHFLNLYTQEETPKPNQSKKRSSISSSSKTRKQNFGGEIVEVEGGHIVRSIGRKDRHSKVCTAKGPRDRRVRLSANTAIQFYDVQDRLGYDRPSKAVDWLMKKAKNAIDELEKLPPWKPTIEKMPDEEKKEQEEQWLHSFQDCDTIKSFFPMDGSNSGNCSSAMEFQSFEEHNLVTSQDLKLSLQSFHDDELHFQEANLFDASGCSSEPPCGGASRYLCNSPFAPPLVQQLLCQNQYSFTTTQRGTLQSINSPSIHAWMDHPVHNHQYGFASEEGGFSGFRIPARIQGETILEEHDGISDKPCH